MKGDSNYPREHWLCRLAGGLAVAGLRAVAFVSRLIRPPSWKKKN